MKFNKIYLLLLLTFASPVLLPSFSAVAQQKMLSKVVIDPGHGGRDPGATLRGAFEKDINLGVALKLGELIKQNYPDVEVIYTRDRDIFIGLAERGDIANRENADLFISIHTNSARAASARGFETFIMGVDGSSANLEVAMRENDVITYEEDYQTKYQGFESGSAESYIMFSLMQYAYQEQSRIFAGLVQQHYAESIVSANRGVKQAIFLVLVRTTMPSVLTELGFISNADDYRLLASGEQRNNYAAALFNAFSEYKTRVDLNSTYIITPAGASVDAETTPSSGTAQQAPPESRVSYSVQIAGGNSRMNMNNPPISRFRGQVTESKIDNTYRYFVGRHAKYADAQEALKSIREVVKGAFIVGFVDGAPALLSEARKLE